MCLWWTWRESNPRPEVLRFEGITTITQKASKNRRLQNPFQNLPNHMLLVCISTNQLGPMIEAKVLIYMSLYIIYRRLSIRQWHYLPNTLVQILQLELIVTISFCHLCYFFVAVISWMHFIC